MAPSDSALAIGPPLTEAELGDAENLVREAGWNQTADDWRMFRQLGTVRAIRDAGRVVATAATLPYGGRFGWISMVLVAGAYQRRGLATRLLRRCIDDLATARLIPVLDATPAGREVYRGLGFVDSWSFKRLAVQTQYAPAGAPAFDGSISVQPITDDVWPRLCAYDAAIFGADRGALLASLRRRLPEAALYAQRGGRIAGLSLGRDGRIATQIGPLVADDDAVAVALLTRALAAIDGGPIFIDVQDTCATILRLLIARGFAPQRPLTRMLLGRASAFDDGTRTFAVLGPEFG